MMRIRPATLSDAQSLADLCGQLGYSSTPAQLTERLNALAKRPDHIVLIAEHDGRVAAFMQVSEHASIESGSWAEIDGLVVDAALRSRGIGRALVAEAASWARSRELTRLRVRTNELRADAHLFYEREGFTLAKTQRVYGRSV